MQLTADPLSLYFQSTQGAGPDGVSYAYANGALLTRLDPVLGAIVRLENRVMAFPVSLDVFSYPSCAMMKHPSSIVIYAR